MMNKRRFAIAVMLTFIIFLTGCEPKPTKGVEKNIDNKRQNRDGSVLTVGPDIDAFSMISQTAGPAVVKKPTVKKAIEKKVVISWKKARGAKVYYVYRSKKKNSGFKLIGRTKKTTFTDKKIKKKKTVYYRIISAADESKAKPSKSTKVYVYPKHPKTVIIGECFVVALEKEKRRFPSYYRFIGEAGMSMYSIQNDSSFSYNGRNVTPLEKAALMKPDRLIFLVGANYSGSHDPKKSAHQLIKMKKLMKKINPYIQMVVLSVSPWKKNSTYGRKLPSHQKRHAFNAAYRAVAKSDKNIYYCALPLRLEDANHDLKSMYDGGDGLHWSWLARTKMAGWIQKWCRNKFHTA